MQWDTIADKMSQ